MNILDFYSDIDMQTPVISPPVGVAALTGSAADLSTWSSIGQYTYDSGFYRKIYRRNINASSGIVLGGTGAIATIFSPYNWVTGSTPEITDGNFRNAFFINVHNKGTELAPYYRGIYLQIDGSQYQDNQGYWHFSPYIRIGNYRADPSNVITDKQNRTNYKYYTGSDYEFAAEASESWTSTSQFNQIAMYSCVVNETDYFLFVLGVNNGALHPSNSVTAVLIPRSYFKYNIPKPYVGPVSKDSAEAFTPVIPHRDSIASRDLTGKKDPYGFNTGNGMKLVVATRETHAQLVRQIYTGYSGNILNALGQAVSSVVGGNDHRNAEEIQQMINCVLCCHLVPKITDTYSGTATTLYTLGGYALFNPAKAVNEVVSQIVEATTTPQRIDPIVNNFLSFAPYCQVSLSVPFVGDISIDPSAIFNSSIYFHFFIDLFTGTLSVDVHLVDDDGRDYIYATRQTNCAIDIPIMGTGATGNPLQKIASAAINGAHYGGAVGAGAGGIFQTVSEASAPHSAAVGRGSTSNIAPYFSCRRCYLVIAYPESSNAANYFNLNGGVINKEGTVGDYTGYSEFEAVNLDGITATDQEKRQILEILRGGVFV